MKTHNFFEVFTIKNRGKLFESDQLISKNNGKGDFGKEKNCSEEGKMKRKKMKLKKRKGIN